MGSFDAKTLRQQRQKRRAKLRDPDELRQLSPGDVSHIDVSRLVLSEIPAGLALRLSLMLLLRFLRLRFESGALSKLRRERMRQAIVRLVHDLASGDPEAESYYFEPEYKPEAIPPARVEALPTRQRAQAIAPPERKAETPLPPRVSATDSATNAALAAVAAPQVRELSRDELVSQLTPDELRLFERAATRDFKHIFEDALHAEYRQSLTRLFGGPIHVRLDRDHVHTPRLLVRFQDTHECVLPDDRNKLVASNPRVLSLDLLDEATAHLWELWKAAKRPNEFAIEAAA